jgi:hypothetical protein
MWLTPSVFGVVGGSGDRTQRVDQGYPSFIIKAQRAPDHQGDVHGTLPPLGDATVI